MVAIFDRCIHIKNDSKKGLEDVTEEKLDLLDRMLTEYNVPHAFALATTEDIDKIYGKNPGCEYCCDLEYAEKDEVTVVLLYLLWSKVYRGANDEQIKKAFQKSLVWSKVYRAAQDKKNKKESDIEPKDTQKPEDDTEIQQRVQEIMSMKKESQRYEALITLIQPVYSLHSHCRWSIEAVADIANTYIDAKQYKDALCEDNPDIDRFSDGFVRGRAVTLGNLLFEYGWGWVVGLTNRLDK